jgi:PAS domain S-box-containing protein
MSDVNRVRPKTFDEALHALEEVEAKLSAREADEVGIRRLAESVHKSDELFRMLAEGVPNHLLFLDPELRIVFANDVFLEATGWSEKKAVGVHISDVVGVERFLERQPYYQRALAGETVSYDSTGAAGSENGFFHFSYRPSFDESGNVRGIFSMATDISERRKIQLELEAKQTELLRSNKDLEQFAYVASHDLKAPLRAIELLVQWIVEGLAGYDTNGVQENLALLGKRTQRLNRLLDDLLAYSRAGRKVGAYRMSDTHALVLDVAQMIDPPPMISISIEGTLPKFKTHPTPLEQVLRNLMSNAVKHHPGPEGRVVVSCKEEGDRYVFAVQDDGEGIPQEYSERVFEMFQTLKPRDQVEGSGMGLAIVNRIVQWQGGRVWFEPAPSGRGTVFKFQWKKNQPLAANVETKACEAAG